MAVTADKVVVELELKDGQYLAKVRQAEAQFNRAQDGMAKSAKSAERQIKASSGAVAASIRSMAGALAAGASVGAVVKLADSYTALQSRLKALGLEGEALAKTENRLYEIANRNGTTIDAVTQLYQRASMARQNLGASEQQLMQIVSGVSASLRLQGTSATEASGALLQFGQILGGSKVQAQEYNSLIDQMPVLLEAVAKGSDRWGGSVAKLSADVKAGKVATQEFANAALKGFAEIEAKAESLPKTVGQALQILNNELGRYVGQTDKSLSATERLANGIVMIADNLDRVVPALAALSALVGVRWAAGMLAAAVATDGFIGKNWQAVRETIAAEKAKTAAVAAETRNRILLINSEVVALRRQVDTGRNAAGQFINVANAQAQLSARTKDLASALPAAAAATARNSTAMVGLSAGVRGAGAALTAFAGGPVGVAILAVGALAFGIVALHKRLNELEPAQRNLNSKMDEARKASEDYEKALIKVSTAQGQAKKTAQEEAAALRALTLKRIEDTKAAIKQAEAELLVAQARADSFRRGQELLNNVPTRGDAGMGGALGGAGYVQGNFDKGVERGTKNIEEQRVALGKLQEDVNNFEANLGSVLGGGADDGGAKSKADKDRRAETLADLREQVAIEEAQLQGNEALVRSLEQQAEERARIKQLVDAGFSQSQAEIYNEEIKAKLAKARADDMERSRQDELSAHSLTLAQINGEIEIVRQLEREAELNELIEKHKKTTLSTEEAIAAANKEQRELNDARAFAAGQYLDTVQKSHSLRIAEILGDKERVKLLTDQEEITRRTNELRAQGLLDEKAARELARNQVTTERAATEYASQREFFASTFSEGMRAAMAGDLKGFLSSQFGNIADQAFRKLGETLFDSFMNVPADIATAQIEGAAQGVAAGTAISTAMITSSVTAGTTIGGAMTAAGFTAAKAIAAAMASGEGSKSAFSFLSAFGGNRAGGGPVKAGSAYTVGESGRETFVPSQNGYIIPNMQNVRANAGAPSMVKLIVDEGSMFQARVEQISGPIAVQAAVTSTSYSNTQAKTSQRRRSQSFV